MVERQFQVESDLVGVRCAVPFVQAEHVAPVWYVFYERVNFLGCWRVSVCGNQSELLREHWMFNHFQWPDSPDSQRKYQLVIAGYQCFPIRANSVKPP